VTACDTGCPLASKPPIAPSPPDLPDELVAVGPPATLSGGELEQSLLQRSDLAGEDARRLRLVEARLVDVDLTGAALDHATLRDVIVQEGSWANVGAGGVTVRRVVLDRVRLTGADLSNGVLEDVSFVDCRLDLSSFRQAKLSRVRFQGCRMEEADFNGAMLSSCVFDDCVLMRTSWAGATLTRSEMRGVDLAGAGNPECLRGVRMPWADVVNAAAELAAAVGIEIVD
jgi:uncharacterized protein YjbI with pentapeptide repeats